MSSWADLESKNTMNPVPEKDEIRNIPSYNFYKSYHPMLDEVKHKEKSGCSTLSSWIRRLVRYAKSNSEKEGI